MVSVPAAGAPMLSLKQLLAGTSLHNLAGAIARPASAVCCCSSEDDPFFKFFPASDLNVKQLW